jgi:hypothetical protein
MREDTALAAPSGTTEAVWFILSMAWPNTSISGLSTPTTLLTAAPIHAMARTTDLIVMPVSTKGVRAMQHAPQQEPAPARIRPGLAADGPDRSAPVPVGRRHAIPPANEISTKPDYG